VYWLHAQIVVTPKWQWVVITDRVASDLRSSFEGFVAGLMSPSTIRDRR